MPSFENVIYEPGAPLARVTVNRPAKMNALNRATVGEIADAVELAIADDAVRAIAITGAGDKAFVAGADIKEMAALDAEGGQALGRYLQGCLDRIERSPKPVIAQINGFALGGGCELAMACHLRFAAEGAKLGQPEVNLGLIPGAGGTQRLTRLVGRGRALDLVLSGDLIGADEALRIGLVERVVPAGELAETVESYAAKLATKSPIAQSRAIEAIVAGSECSQSEALRLEAALFGLCFATEDMREGTRAFIEKRKAEFKGH